MKKLNCIRNPRLNRRMGILVRCMLKFKLDYVVKNKTLKNFCKIFRFFTEFFSIQPARFYAFIYYIMI